MAAILKKLILRWCPEPLLIELKKLHYSRVLRNASAIEEEDFPVVRRLVAPGDRVLDVGANIGVYTKLLAEQVGPTGHVWSIEPIPATYKILRHNARKLGLAHVEPINCAVSETDGNVTMEIPEYDSGGENFYEAHIIKSDGKSGGQDRRNSPSATPTVAQPPSAAHPGAPKAPCRLRRLTVQTRRLDSIFPENSPAISFIKCDVEGHELSCMRGAMALVRRCKPAWLIEISRDLDDPQSTSAQMAALLAEEGYAAYWFDGAALRPRRPGDRSVNYFFLTGNHLAAYVARGGDVACGDAVAGTSGK